MNSRQILEAALRDAEAILHKAVGKLADVGADRAAASDNLERARANCRQAHAALSKFKNSEQA